MMQTKEIRLEKSFPVTHQNGKRRLQLPDQMEMLMEDGTDYHVRSFFSEQGRMSDLLDALTIEKLSRRV